MVTKVKSKKTHKRSFKCKTIKRVGVGSGSRGGARFGGKSKKHTFESLKKMKTAVNTAREYQLSEYPNLFKGSNPDKLKESEILYAKPKTSRQHGIAKKIENYMNSTNKNKEFSIFSDKLYSIYGNKEERRIFDLKLRELLGLLEPEHHTKTERPNPYVM